MGGILYTVAVISIIIRAISFLVDIILADNSYIIGNCCSSNRLKPGKRAKQYTGKLYLFYHT